MTPAELDTARTLRRVAEHESAHAVTAALQGARVTGVEIGADGGGRTHVVWPHLSSLELNRRRAVCAAAGELADPDWTGEASRDDRRVGAGTDWGWPRVRSTAAGLLEQPAARDATRELVRELMDRGSLDGPELDRILRRLRR